MAGPDVNVVDRALEDVGDDLSGRRLVALTLRGRAQRDDDLAEDVELDRRNLVVPRELQLGIDHARLAKVVRARVESRADADPEQLAARLCVRPARLDARVVDQVERDVEHLRIVARVVDAAIRRLVRHLFGANVVLLAHLDGVELELVGDDVDHPLGEPEVLHARVAAVRRDGGLVRRHLSELDANVAPAVHAGRHLRPDDAAERLVAQPGAGVVERLRPEPEQGAVVLDGHLGLEEPALVAVRHRHVEVGAPLRPLHGAAELASEQAAHDELRMGCDLVAEAAADVLCDEAELVEPAVHSGAHHDRGEAGELVVRVDRPLPDAAVVLDERAVTLERCRVEAVEVELVDLDDLVRLRERGVEVAPLVDAFPHQVAAGVLVDRRRAVGARVARVRDRRDRLVLDLDQLRCVACKLPRLGDDGDDRLADVTHLAHGQRVVLQVRARDRRDLEERIGERRHLFAGQRAVDAGRLLGLRDVDRRDVRVRVWRAHEVDVAHAVPLDVVDEDSLALDEAAILLARNALSLPGLLGDVDLLGHNRGGAHSAAALTASKMFQ